MRSASEIIERTTVLAVAIGVLTVQLVVPVWSSAARGGEATCVAGRADEQTSSCCTSCGESNELDEGTDDDTSNPGRCCPGGCKQCPRPCCSGLVMVPVMIPAALLIEPYPGRSLAARQPDVCSVAPDRIFHPPRRLLPVRGVPERV